MLDKHKGHATPGGHFREELLQRLLGAYRGPYANHNDGVFVFFYTVAFDFGVFVHRAPCWVVFPHFTLPKTIVVFLKFDYSLTINE
jgi:hypothetical protein